MKPNDYTKRSTPFGEVIYVGPQQTSAVIICENIGLGIRPLSLRLWHQIYWDDVKDIRGLTLIPVRIDEYIHLGAPDFGGTLAEQEAAHDGE